MRLDKGVRSKPLSPRERGWGEGGFGIGRMATHAAGGLEDSGEGRTVLPPPFPHPRPLSQRERGGTQSPCREGEKGGHSSVSTPMTPRPAPSMNDARVLSSMICGDKVALAGVVHEGEIVESVGVKLRSSTSKPAQRLAHVLREGRPNRVRT